MASTHIGAPGLFVLACVAKGRHVTPTREQDGRCGGLKGKPTLRRGWYRQHSLSQRLVKCLCVGVYVGGWDMAEVSGQLHATAALARFNTRPES
jgi:hypothetical protein